MSQAWELLLVLETLLMSPYLNEVGFFRTALPAVTSTKRVEELPGLANKFAWLALVDR